MSEMKAERTVQIIAAEIHNFIGYSRKTKLMCAIEIGQRLVEAKELIPHGEWYHWLEETVNYSNSTATRLMQIYREYGPAFFASGNGSEDANRATLHALTYSQALVLLDIPEDERAEIITGLDIENTTTLELKKAVTERRQLKKEQEASRQELEDLQKALADEKAKNTQITDELSSLKTEAQKLQVYKLDMEKSYNFKTIQSMSKRLDTEYSKALANKIPYLYDDLEETFRRLMQEMRAFAAVNEEEHTSYKKKLHGFLVKALEYVAMI